MLSIEPQVLSIGLQGLSIELQALSLELQVLSIELQGLSIELQVLSIELQVFLSPKRLQYSSCVNYIMVCFTERISLRGGHGYTRACDQNPNWAQAREILTHRLDMSERGVSPHGLFYPWVRWDRGLADFRNCSAAAGVVFDEYLKNTSLQEFPQIARVSSDYKSFFRLQEVPQITIGSSDYKGFFIL